MGLWEEWSQTPPPSACLWARAGQGHDDSKTIFAMSLQLLQGTSIIDALGITASFPGEAVGGSESGSGRWEGAESEVAMTVSGLTPSVPPAPGT